MKLCFYSPYFPDHFGGGEKHLLDVAVVASQEHEVSIAVSPTKISGDRTIHKIQTEYEEFFGKSLETISFIESPLGTRESAIEKLLWTGQFDGMYYVTDGSFFFSLARHNFLHIQVPLKINLSPLQRIKLNMWQHKNVNSEFTKEFIEREWQTSIQQVIYPSVDIELLKNTEKKEKIILNVGRFFKQLHSKRQDVLIKMFSQLISKHPTEMNGWKLVLIGAIEDQAYFDELQQLAKGLPIEFRTDVNRAELVAAYKSASIYWHATGFGIDETTSPEKVEHFGISTVEALAAGAIPIVHYKGGQKEILGSELQELGWLTKEQCVSITQSIISDKQAQEELRKLASQRVQRFGTPLFTKKVLQLFKK